jgi:predicted N-acetyltransferase YhbS
MNRLREARKGDEKAILAVMSSAFRREAGTAKYERDEHRIHVSLEEHYVLEAEGRILGVVHIKSDEIQVGASVIRKADVGEVSILAGLQDNGLGTDMMRQVVVSLREQGYHISRLGGYRQFYERFGWVPFPRGYIDFALAGLTSRGGFTDPVTYLNKPEEDRHIRGFSAADAAACAAVYAKFNARRTGAPPERGFPQGKAPGAWNLVYEREGKVLAYLFGSENSEPHTRFATAISIRDAAVDPADPQPLGELIRHTLRAAALSGAKAVSAKLPLDASLYDLYRDSSTGFVPTLWQSSEGGNMIQVLNFRKLVEAVLPELQQRVRDENLEDFQLALSCVGGSVTLMSEGRELSLSDTNGKPIEIRQDHFCKMLLGIQSPDAVLQGFNNLKPRDRAIFRALFPAQPTATGVWG